MRQIAVDNLELFLKSKKIAFYGDLGAGKTTLIQQICKALGVKENVSSPTFAIINEYYRNGEQPPSIIHHVDLYRLNTIEEALDVGIEECLYDDYFCFIEWPELIEPLFPDTILKISIEMEGKSKRKVIFL